MRRNNGEREDTGGFISILKKVEHFMSRVKGVGI
jgi:hypothetical protein